MQTLTETPLEKIFVDTDADIRLARRRNVFRSCALYLITVSVSPERYR